MPANSRGTPSGASLAAIDRRDLLVSQVRCQVPIVPTVITAEDNAASSGGSARDAHRHRQRLAPSPRIPYLTAPRMQCEEQVGQFHFVRRDQATVTAAPDTAVYGGVDRRIRMAQQDGSDTASEIDVTFAVEIPNAFSRTT